MIQHVTNSRGYLKFSDDRVSLEQLQEFAQELAKDQKFLSVYIRKVSKDQHGIGFISNVDTSTKEASDKFNEEVKDVAMRRFGVGLVGWDISSSYIPIK